MTEGLQRRPGVTMLRLEWCRRRGRRAGRDTHTIGASGQACRNIVLQQPLKESHTDSSDSCGARRREEISNRQVARIHRATRISGARCRASSHDALAAVLHGRRQGAAGSRAGEIGGVDPDAVVALIIPTCGGGDAVASVHTEPLRACDPVGTPRVAVPPQASGTLEFDAVSVVCAHGSERGLSSARATDGG